MSVVTLICSCNSSDSRHDAIVNEMIGIEMNFPEELQFQIKDTPIDYDFESADFKIVTYIDSTGCSPCRLKLAEWDEIINDLKTRENPSVNFLMILDKMDTTSISKMIEVYDFLHPVCYDNGSFVRHNRLPNDELCQTFLLDSDNKIVAIGNPAMKSRIKDLYNKRIFSSNNGLINKRDSALDRKRYIPLGILKANDTTSVSITVWNEDTIPINVKSVYPSCPCIKVDYGAGRIEPKESIELNVKIIPDAQQRGEYQQSIIIKYNENENPETIMLQGYV